MRNSAGSSGVGDGTPPSHIRRSVRARDAFLRAGALVLSLGLAFMAPAASADVSTAVDPVYATAGIGAYRSNIMWIPWSTGTMPESQDVTMSLGGGNYITCSYAHSDAANNDSVASFETGTNSWSGGLNHLYRGTGITGLKNNTNYGNAYFTFSCSAYREVNGNPTPIRLSGLVFADAESNNWDSGKHQEYIFGSPIEKDNGSYTWRLLDSARSCTSSSSVADYPYSDAVGGVTHSGIRFRSNGLQCDQSAAAKKSERRMEG